MEKTMQREKEKPIYRKPENWADRLLELMKSMSWNDAVVQLKREKAEDST